MAAASEDGASDEMDAEDDVGSGSVPDAASETSDPAETTKSEWVAREGRGGVTGRGERETRERVGRIKMKEWLKGHNTRAEWSFEG